jgi:hypothetical protein
MNEIGRAILAHTDHRIPVAVFLVLLATWALYFRRRSGSLPAMPRVFQFLGLYLTALGVVGLVALLMTNPMACEVVTQDGRILFSLTALMGSAVALSQQFAACIPPLRATQQLPDSPDGRDATSPPGV